MNRTRIAQLTIATTAVACLAACANTPGGSDDGDGGLPSGTIKIVVPFAAGGSLDTNARILSECLGENTDNNWVVENREGGGGTTGVNYVLSSTPNGATVGYVSSSGIALTPLQVDEAEYTMDDIAPLAVVTGAPSVIVTAAGSGFDTLADLLESDDGADRTVATTGALGIYQLVAQRLATDADVRPVPFDGAAAATTAALGANADAAIVELSDSILDYVEGGQLRAIGTGAEEPVEALPDAELFDDAGYELPISTNYGVFIASPDTPDDTKTALEDAFLQCAQDDTVIERIGTEFVLESPYGSTEAQELLEQARADYEAALG